MLNIMCLIADDGWPFRHMTEQDRNTLRSKIEGIHRETDAIDRILPAEKASTMGWDERMHDS